MRSERVRTGLVAMLVLLVCLSADPFAGAPAGAADRGARPPRHVTLTLVDRSRPTEDPSGTRSASSRTLVTEVYLPRGKGPFPLIVFAHGFGGNPGKLTQMLSAWARAGYVVAAPTFPLTNDLTPAPQILVDYVNQSADLSFVIDQVQKRSRRRDSPLSRKVDSRHIGLAGHSLGGATVYGAAFNECCRDRRVDAAVVMDGRAAPFAENRFSFRGTPILLIHLTGDPVVPFSYAQDVYDRAAPPKYLMALSQGVHFEPFEDVPNPHDAAVVATTIAFWDSYLDGKPGARRAIVRAGTEPGLSTVTARAR
jgi:dienelactone hydrolase